MCLQSKLDISSITILSNFSYVSLLKSEAFKPSINSYAYYLVGI